MCGSSDGNFRAAKKGPAGRRGEYRTHGSLGAGRSAVQQKLLMYAKWIAQGREGLFS